MEATGTYSTPLVTGGAIDHSHTTMGQEGALVQEKIAAMKIQSGHDAGGGVSSPPVPAPLTLSLRSNNISTSTLAAEEPDSPTSPSSCSPPDGYPPLFLTWPVNLEAYTDSPPGKYTSCATDTEDVFQLFQDDDEPPFDFDGLEYGDMYPPSSRLDHYALMSQQSIEFAETALQYYNDDPNNEVKYELITATESSYISEGSCGYGHVNFTARANQEGSEEQLFFAELRFRDETTLTCFCCLKEEQDQVGGLVDMDNMEGKGETDLKHCYACWDALKHPRDGASYHAGHWTGRRR